MDSKDPHSVPNSVDRAVWMAAVELGLSVEEALAATKQPCSNKTLYRRVALKRAAIETAAAEGTRAFLGEDAEGLVVAPPSDCDVSTLTESPKRRRRMPEQPSISMGTTSTALSNASSASSSAATSAILNQDIITTSKHEEGSMTEEKGANLKIFLRKRDPLPSPIEGCIRLVFLSDTHGEHGQIPLPLPDGDVLFHLGDASNRGSMSIMMSFAEWMRTNSSHKERIVIDGNHDRDMFPRNGRSRRDFMAAFEGVATVLKNEVVEVADGRMSIVGVAWDACEREDFGEAIDSIQKWSSIAGNKEKSIDLVLSHFPPYVRGGGRGWRGSKVLSNFVKAIRPPLHCFGHVHHARGVRAYGPDALMLNCASTWNEPVVIDYCPSTRRAVMIHCPLPEEYIYEHLNRLKSISWSGTKYWK